MRFPAQIFAFIKVQIRKLAVVVAAAFFMLGNAACSAQGNSGHLLLDSYGKLFLVAPDGSQSSLAEHINQAALSPDGSKIAFTTDSNPRLAGSQQKLIVMAAAGGQQ